jgi:hypothetical protein
MRKLQTSSPVSNKHFNYVNRPIGHCAFLELTNQCVCLTDSYSVSLELCLFTGGADYRYFDIDRNSGHVTIKRTIPDDDLIQPATLVVRVRK